MGHPSGLPLFLSLLSLLPLSSGCVLCPLNVPPRPRPLDQFKIPSLPKIDTESMPQFCNLTQWLPVGDVCREGISRVLCSADSLIDAHSNGCPGADQPELCSACEKSKPANFWVVSWFDSLGKMPAGVSDGNYYWLGDYEICHQLAREHKFAGQYCWVRLEIPDALVEAGCPQTDPLEIILGICAPVNCQPDELKKISEAYAPYKVRVECELERHVSLPGKIALALLSVYLVTIIAVTFLEGREIGPGLLRRFSLNITGKKVLSTKRNQHTSLHVIAGLEFVAYSWIIVGDVYNIMLPYIENVAFAFDGVGNLFPHLTNNYSYHVDGLIALSSFFTASMLYGRLESAKDVIRVLLKALLRFWPSYALLIMFMSVLFPHIASGPMWIHGDIATRCASSWWKNLLFINNFFSVRDTCVDFGYAVSLQAQYFALITVLCYLARNHIRIVLQVSILGVVASIVYSFCIIYIYELPPAPVLTAEPIDPSQMESLLNLLVVSPLARLGPPMLGLLFALVSKPDVDAVVITIGGMLSLIAALFTGFFLLTYTSGRYTHPLALAAYGSTHRVAWAFALLTLAYLCTHGPGLQTVEAFLGWRVFSPLSKRVWVALVVAEPIILHFFSALHRPAYATHWSTIYAVVSAGAVSLMMSLLIDAFFGRTIRHCFEPTPPPETKTNGDDVEMNDR